MLELKQTEQFRRWRTRLKDERARASIASVWIVLLTDMLATRRQSERGSANCAFTKVLVIASTFTGRTTRW